MIYIGQLVSWSLVGLEGHFLFLFSLSLSKLKNKTKQKKRLKDKKPETDEIENEIRS